MKAVTLTELYQARAEQSDSAFRPAALALCNWFEELLGLLFPQRAVRSYRDAADVGEHAADLRQRLGRLVDSAELAGQLMARLPELHTALCEDASAIFEADPAAGSPEEVIAVYNTFYAIACYRVANALAVSGVKLLPRALSEFAHARTGIDIHPEASIGRRFCIDHGTGVVIGQTTVIGADVRIYQGVTLGGTSLHRPERPAKRHPTIEDRVIIYANATVLGGDTVIGHDSVLGGSVWVTSSVPPHSKVVFEPVVRTSPRAGGKPLTCLRPSLTPRWST